MPELTVAAARETLVELEREERIVSAKRRRLHERIDFLAAEKFGVYMTNRLDRLIREEKELSKRRRELHAQIDAIRTAAGLPSYREEQRKRMQGVASSPDVRPTCILLELVNGTLRCFDFQDENLAATWYERCRDDWRADRAIVVSMRPGATFSSGSYSFPGRGVVRLEIVTRRAALELGARCVTAAIRLGPGASDTGSLSST